MNKLIILDCIIMQDTFLGGPYFIYVICICSWILVSNTISISNDVCVVYQ